MCSTKVLPALACALLFISCAAHAQPKATPSRTQPVSPQLPSTDPDLRAESPASGSASQPAAASPVSAAAASVPAEPRLSIEDVDRIARSSIARQLAGSSGGQTGLPLNGAAPVTAPATAPVPVAIRPPLAHPRAEPVRFVGAFSDVTGQSVLYEYRNASYPAHVGARLLNGWTVKSVNGFVVTVTEGTGKAARTWTETISGGTPAQDSQQTAATNLLARGMPDLSGPLPPSLPLSAVGR
jgi:hypothetical protein